MGLEIVILVNWWFTTGGFLVSVLCCSVSGVLFTLISLTKANKTDNLVVNGVEFITL